MVQNLDENPAAARDWLEKALLAPTLAEAAFYNRKARLAQERMRSEPCGTGRYARTALGRRLQRLFH